MHYCRPSQYSDITTNLFMQTITSVTMYAAPILALFWPTMVLNVFYLVLKVTLFLLSTGFIFWWQFPQFWFFQLFQKSRTALINNEATLCWNLPPPSSSLLQEISPISFSKPPFGLQSLHLPIFCVLSLFWSAKIFCLFTDHLITIYLSFMGWFLV